MRTRRYEVDDEDEDDDILKDGESLRVPGMIMDSEPRSFVMDASAYAGMSVTGDRSPLIGDAAQQRLDDAYADAEKALNEAWRNPGPAKAPPAVRSNDDRSNAADDLEDADVDAAHAAHETWLTNAWRTP
jgi:hypothetical protein